MVRFRGGAVLSDQARDGKPLEGSHQAGSDPAQRGRIHPQRQRRDELADPGPCERPIVINGSLSSCASGYFVSIQLSDASWNRYGFEANRWLTSQDFATYGPINSFNVKKFAEDQWFSFVPGQYYSVKLAVGSPWSESSKLIQITP